MRKFLFVSLLIIVSIMLFTVSFADTKITEVNFELDLRKISVKPSLYL